MGPQVAILLIPLVFAVATAVIVIRRRRHGALDIGPVTAFVGGAYALVVSLLLVSAIGQFDAARYAVDDEGAFSANLFANASSFPTADRVAIQHGVVCLLRSTITDDWPAVAAGSDLGDPRTLQRQWQLISAVTAAGKSVEQSPSTLTAYDHALENLDARNAARNRRLFESRTATTPAEWIVLLVGAFIVIVLVGLELKTSDRATQILVLGMLMATIALLLAAIALIDTPYSGSWRIDPTDLESQLATLRTMPGSAEVFRPCAPLVPAGT